MQWEKPSRPEEPRPETERRRRRRTGQRQRPREHTIAATNTDVPVETDTRTGVDTRGKGQLASGCLGRCDCVTTVGLTSLPQFCPRPLQRGRGSKESGTGAQANCQPWFLPPLASSRQCPWHTRRLRVTSCTCVPGTQSGTDWSTSPWLPTPTSRSVRARGGGLGRCRAVLRDCSPPWGLSLGLGLALDLGVCL